MTTTTLENFHRIKAIFEQALDYESEAERQVFLDETCINLDDEIRHEVEALLAEHKLAGGFLAKPAALVDELRHQSEAQITEADALAWLPADRIIDGRYHVERVIAIGGMGVVYEATQEKPHRRVALKAMRRGLFSHALRRRFQYEADTLARLTHAHIAQVYDAGVHAFESVRENAEALPYFVMQYIEDAQPITQYARNEKLKADDRIRLFLNACSAVQHGHQHGIIHRDIKPDNILVDAEGSVKVIDFGVARITDSDVAATTTLRTAVGEIVGTVQYMSPEQCDGDPHEIDTRSDVYSLGLVLYELLSDELPYDLSEMSVITAMRAVQETLPRHLSEINKRLRGDLEIIVDKALAKVAAERYQSVSDLCADLENHLNAEPIRASRPTLWVRVTRWMGRHPIATTSIVSFWCAVIILTVTVGMIWYGKTRPFTIVVSPSGRSAQLISLLGDTIATFGSESDGGSKVKIKIVERPDRFGSGRVILLCVYRGERSTNHQLWMCSLDDLDHPIWQTEPRASFDPPDLPASWNARSDSSGFIVHDFIVANIISHTRENEIAVIQGDGVTSANVVRVYDFAGNVLYEAWHLGHLSHVWWWRDTGLLICGGNRHGRPDVSRFGYRINESRWPTVVFALSPNTEQSRRWINATGWPGDWIAETEVNPELAQWYRVLRPHLVADEFFSIASIDSSLSTASTPELVVGFNSPDTGVITFGIDKDGNQTYHTFSDTFFQTVSPELQTTKPYLTDWPPPIPVQSEEDHQ